MPLAAAHVLAAPPPSLQIETVGDGVIVVGGLDGATERDTPALPPAPADWSAPLDPSLRRPLSHVGKTALFALDILREIEQMNVARYDRASSGGLGRSPSAPLAMRIGLHAGEAVGGIVGTSRPRYFIWGPETVVANKLESSGTAGQIQVSEAVATRLYSEGFRLRPCVESGVGEASPSADCPSSMLPVRECPPDPLAGAGAVRTFFLDSFQFERTTEHGRAELIDVKVACE